MTIRMLFGSVIVLTVVSLVMWFKIQREIPSTVTSAGSGPTPDDRTAPPRAKGQTVVTYAKRSLDPVVNDPQFHSQLLEIAKSYENYGRVDATMWWGLPDCALPPVMPFTPRFSQSSDGTTHGEKLFFLFVRDLNAHGSLDKNPQPTGQALVKQSWRPTKVDSKQVPRAIGSLWSLGPSKASDQSYFLFAEKDGEWYHAEEKMGLFIMTKIDPRTPGTDDGWIYGTVTADGKSVTSSGRVTSCMDCHRQFVHDRLFGLKWRGFGTPYPSTQSK